METPISDALAKLNQYELSDLNRIGELCKLYNFTPKKKRIQSIIKELKEFETKLCYNCHKCKGNIKHFIPDDIRLCKECKELRKYKLITKSTAIKLGADKNTIMNIPHIEVDNPHYSCAAPMILFRESDFI